MKVVTNKTESIQNNWCMSHKYTGVNIEKRKVSYLRLLKRWDKLIKPFSILLDTKTDMYITKVYKRINRNKEIETKWKNNQKFSNLYHFVSSRSNFRKKFCNRVVHMRVLWREWIALRTVSNAKNRQLFRILGNKQRISANPLFLKSSLFGIW